MADSSARRRSLIVLILAVLAIAAFFAVLVIAANDDPADDLAARVQAVVPVGIGVEVSGSDVFLSGEFDDDIDDLIAIVAAVEGVGRVFTDDLGPPVAAPTTVTLSTTPPTTAPLPEVDLDTPTFNLQADRQSAVVSGTLPDEEIVAEIEHAMRRLFGRNGVDNQLRVGIVDSAPWVSGLPQAVMVAADTEAFELDVTVDGATVSGIVRDQAAADQLIADLTLALGFEPLGFIDTRDIGGKLTALLRGVATFETGSAELSDDGIAVLDEAAALLLSGPEVLIRVVGHTDSVGDRQSNQILSEDRAQAVVDYLVSEGVDSSQLIASGFGETKPIADNATEEGRAQNRRIEFVVGG